jgi:hypothetical protein
MVKSSSWSGGPQRTEAGAAPGKGVTSNHDALQAVAQLAVTFEKPVYHR